MATTIDNRFSRRWSTMQIPDAGALPAAHATTTSTTLHVSSQKYPSATSYSTSSSLPSRRDSKQRWSTIPTSSLAIVETIDYEEEEQPEKPVSVTPATVAPLRRRQSIVHLKAIMRQIFSKKDKDVPPLPTKPLPARSIKTKKSEPVLVKNISDKESHLWRRLSIVVRPPKTIDPPSDPITPKRIDSGVDIRSLRDALKPPQRDDSPSALSTTSLPTFPTSHRRTSSVTTSTTISAPPMLLTRAERQHLVHELQLFHTLVEAHSNEAEGFSKNLAGLLWSKEHGIVANKRLNEETRLEMIDTMAKVRESTAKTFARKGAFYERTLSVLDKLLLDLGVGPTKVKGNASTTSLRSLSPDSTLSTSLTLTNSASHSSDEDEDENVKREYALTLPVLRSGLQTLKADLTAHSHLDPALRNGVVKPTKERKFPTSENEMIAMKRFAKFVDGRVKKLGEGYWEMGRWVRNLEGWVDDLEERGC